MPGAEAVVKKTTVSLLGESAAGVRDSLGGRSLEEDARLVQADDIESLLFA